MKSITNQRAERIARNIDAMDINYHYSDDMRVWKFWSGLDKKLRNIIKSLNDEDKNIIRIYCNTDKSKKFGLN